MLNVNIVSIVGVVNKKKKSKKKKKKRISHRKEIRKLTFRALALRRSGSDEGLALEMSAFESFYGG